VTRDVTAAREEKGVARPLPEPVTSLVRVAIESDAPGQLIAAAQHALGKPLGLVGPAGEALGRAPDTDAGDRALAIARAAATSRLVAPPGWWIVDIARASSSFGYLAIGERDSDAEPHAELVELLSTLLADQLQRVALLRSRTSELLRRLVSDSDVGPARARREAAGCGLMLADAYWPAILGWRGQPPRPDVAEAIDRQAGVEASGPLSVTLVGRTVLLHPGDDARGSSGALDWFREVVTRARRVAPSARPQVIVGERRLGLAELSAGVAELDALWRMGPRGEGDEPLVSVRHYALDLLLARTADTAEASEFVRQQIGPLIGWDRRHHTDLLKVLEAGLDVPRHDVAAARCFMHRNTFRHRFRDATKILGDDLDDPDVRLAVHVALKLRRVLAARA
jgi:sugar diacid utilization regulator